MLIGEVWLCGGQSNMDMLMQPLHPWLKGVIDYEKEIAAANYPQIRVLDIASAFAKFLQTIVSQSGTFAIPNMQKTSVQ